MYESLRQGKLPTVSGVKPRTEVVVEKLKEWRRTYIKYLNTASAIRAQSPTKKVSISNVRIEGYRATYRNAYMAKPGDSVRFGARCTYTGLEPETIVITQRVDGKSREDVVLFLPQSYFDVKVDYEVQEPKTITYRVDTAPRLKAPVRYLIDSVRLSTSLTQTYPIGLYDDRYKPTSEYPVVGVDNAVLDIPYTWRVENKVYPENTPPELYFENLSISYLSGFVAYGGKYYRDPSTNNTVRISAKVRNATGYALDVEHWGLLVAVLYDDDRHVSAANVDVSFPSFTLYNNQIKDYTLDVNLPTWAYGKVAVAHALNFYRGGTLIYGGGPFYCFEVFRLRLP